MSEKPGPNDDDGSNASSKFDSKPQAAMSTINEEDALLATLQASRQEQDVYEDRVIREATHQLAPSLTGTNGFPSLETLVHPASASCANVKRPPPTADLPHLHAVLGMTRTMIQQQRKDTNYNSEESDMLFLKEQILLEYMHTVARVPKDDLPIRKNEDHFLMQRRKAQQERPEKPDNATSGMHTKDDPLEGRKRRRVTFGTQDDTGDSKLSSSVKPRLHERVSIMKRKEHDHQARVVEGADVAVVGVFGEEETKERKEELRRLRALRQKRKEARRRAWRRDDEDESAEDESEPQSASAPLKVDSAAVELTSNTEDSTHKSETAVVDLTLEAQAPVDGDQNIPAAEREKSDQKEIMIIKDDDVGNLDKPGGDNSEQKMPPIEEESDQKETLTKAEDGGNLDGPKDVDNMEVVSANRGHPAVLKDIDPLICPVCQTQVDYAKDDDRDEALSAHIALCQIQGQVSTRRSARLRSTTQSSLNVQSGQVEAEQDSSESLSVSSESLKKRKRPAPKSLPPKPATPSLDDLEECAYEDRVDEWIANGLVKMKKMTELDSNNDDGGNDDEAPMGVAQDYGGGLVVPGWIHDRLFGYQREGLKIMWGWHMQGSGGILGDEMGLGKTVSISAFLGSMVSCRRVSSLLLVVPATMLNHWLTELSIWAPGLRRILIHPSGEVDNISRTLTAKLLSSLDKWLKAARSNRVYECIDEEDRASSPPHSFCGTGYAIITTYENVRRNPEIYVGHRFSYIVLDEAQKIRNPDADITLACKRIRTPHRIAMSGTPIMNDLKELWSLFDFAFPGRLGTLPAFEQEFAEPIRKGGYSNASPMQVQLAYRCALVLKDLIEPYLLRRLKKDVKEVSRMPSKTEHVLFCRLSPQQRALYEAFLQSDEVTKVVRGSTNLLGAITMLRKICNHPDLVCDPNESSMERFIKNGFQNTGDESSDEDDNQDAIHDEETLMERSGKLEVLSKILPLWKEQGHRVLIFCQWKKMLNIVQRYMILKGWKFGRLDGNTNIAARQKLVDEFNADESYFAMLCTTRTGGVGLNLTGASRVCLYSPDWNPQIDAQARERAWRFGQKKEVTVYRLITAGTVEEKIYQRQIFKTALSNKVLQDPRQRRLFSQRDLRDLFTLKQDTGSINSGADGVTETGEMTRGGGVVDLDNPVEEEQHLKDVMKSKGLAGIFDHDFIEGSSSAKSATAREMEEEAKKVAREAVKALQNSVAAENQYIMTEPRRFGSSTSSLFQASNNEGQSGSSVGLLQSLKQRSATAAADGANDDMSEYAKLLKRIKVYVKKRRPSTENILKEFSDIPHKDAAIFRRLLKTVAQLKNGHWLPYE